MTTTSSNTPTRRLRVQHDPVPGAKPWRAVIATEVMSRTGTSTLDSMPETEMRPVGRFDTHAEAVTAGCSALRFAAAGIPWTVQS